jgi:hypothetical protein
MHYTTRRFWQNYHALPQEVRQIALKYYQLLKVDPSHPSLHFKKVGQYRSVRVGMNYRALGVEVKDGISWFWIGTHAEYNKIIGM